MFLVDEDFGDGLLPWQEGFGGEEVRPETSGRAPISPGILSKPPRSSSALRLVLRGLLVSGGIPSVKHGMETSRNPAGRPGTVSWGGADPSHLYHPTERPGCSGAEPSAPPRAPGTGRASLKWAEIPQNRVRRNSHPQTRIRGEEQPQGFNTIFPPGREPGPGSWGSQKMSLSSTFSPASGPGMAPAAGPEACESLGFLVHEPGGPCSGPGRGGAAHAGFGLRGLGLRWAEQGMCFGFPEGLTASFHLDV